ncbi:putative transcriptional regulator [Rubidibacter lacunae KORDI 51-2]|uniref:Putative transcriptional regulator n=1 Tax=Rubidibacter lacunae KORDI 51-2 TaxID=582515 RepID=U5DI73_9CHRO|nr:XRE family transcriptional regulator [Rubidibacter lacunae]ERN41371.1 putative transcriptional regulator [Rubidibacter lacunae KORDI 51-2]
MSRSSPQEPPLSAGIGRRIEEIRGELTQQEFARSIRVGLRTLIRYEQEERLPDIEVSARICEVYDVDPGWLMTGKGSLRPPGKSISIRHYDISASAGPGAFADWEPPARWVSIDLEWLRQDLHVSPSDVTLIDVRGDSMTPTLLHGDQMLVSHTVAEPLPPGIYVIRVEGLLLVKRLELQPGRKLQVISDNPVYPPYVVDLTAEGIDFAVLGQVVWMGRNMEE